MTDRRDPRWVVALLVLAITATAGLSGCGVGPNGPRDLGDAFGAATRPEPDVVKPPEPTANSTDQLVLDFLDAAVGGGDAAIRQVSEFFTDKGRRAWLPTDKTPPAITIVRVVGAPSSGAGRDKGVPVDLTYQVVGTLGDNGRVSAVAQPRNQRVRFWVKTGERAPSQLRIDAIEGLDGAVPRLMLRDDALNETYYRERAIYFWDSTNTVLVPDVRYVARTLPPGQVAKLVLGWLSQPSPPGVLPPPANIALAVQPSVRDDQVIVLKLAPQVGIKTQEDADHLLFQLQASLRPSTIEVSVGTQALRSSGPSAYQQYELSSTLAETRKFDITDGVVKPTTGDTGGPVVQPPVLGAATNKNVIQAAISRDLSRAAFVRRIGAATSLVLATSGGSITANLPTGADEVGRPVWVPAPAGQPNTVLVPWNGVLYRVTSDGRASALALGGPVTAVSMSPDGRRIAVIINGQVRVVPISVDRGTVTVPGPAQLIVIDPRLVAAGVAWLSEQQLVIAGSTAGQAALWQVSADGVIAKDRSHLLLDLVPTDVVAFPNYAFASNPSPSAVNAIVLCGEAGPYRIIVGPAAKDGTTHPFFAS